MKWKDLSGQERYHVVQMAREGKVPITELCRSFGVSRQTLKTAMEALTPKSPGRKSKSKDRAKADAMKQEKALLERELDHWKQKYEIAMAFVDIHKKLLNGEAFSHRPGEKKRHKRVRNPRSAKAVGAEGTGAEVAQNGDG